MKISLTSPLLALVFTVGSCGAQAVTPKAASVDACPGDTSHDDAGNCVRPSFGQTCDESVGCADGLTCQKSDFALKPWCTKTCTDINNHCDTSGLNGLTGLCIQMPAGWVGPSEPFCAVECTKSIECTAISPDWQGCQKATYKGVALNNALPTKVCQSPGAETAFHVDPSTCDWQGQVTDPKYQEAKGLTAGYCQFLKACQLLAKDETDACCGWHAFSFMAPSGVVDAAAIAKIKCYIKSFTANQSTSKVCSGWNDPSDGTYCGAIPVQ